MKKRALRAGAWIVLVGALALSVVASSAVAEPLELPELAGEEAQPLSSCQLNRARDMCCPVWCAGKTKHIFHAAKAVSACARSFSCEWSDSTAQGFYHCSVRCK